MSARTIHYLTHWMLPDDEMETQWGRLTKHAWARREMARVRSKGIWTDVWVQEHEGLVAICASGWLGEHGCPIPAGDAA